MLRTEDQKNRQRNKTGVLSGTRNVSRPAFTDKWRRKRRRDRSFLGIAQNELLDSLDCVMVNRPDWQWSAYHTGSCNLEIGLLE